MYWLKSSFTFCKDFTFGMSPEIKDPAMLHFVRNNVWPKLKWFSLPQIKNTFMQASNYSGATFYFEISTILTVFTFSRRGFSLWNVRASLFQLAMGVSVEVDEVKYLYITLCPSEACGQDFNWPPLFLMAMQSRKVMFRTHLFGLINQGKQCCCTW